MNDIVVILPNGTELFVEEGATMRSAAFAIGPGLGKDIAAGVADGEFVDEETPLHDGTDLVVVIDRSDEYLDVLRHSAAHVFAQALQWLHSEAKLTIGPWMDDGFYYDVTSVDLKQEDPEAIKDEMRDIIERDLDIERTVADRGEALEKYVDNPYKRDTLGEKAAGDDELSLCQQGEFEDLCKSPHAESTDEIGAVKPLSIPAVYWRGDEDNDTLTRVYDMALELESDLEESLEVREEAKERDRQKLDQEPNLFAIDGTTGLGLPLYQPNGKRILNGLADYAKQLNLDAGYDPVETPHLFRAELRKKSDHHENYVDSMFPLDVDDEEYGLKSMNCPGYATVFDQQSWPYRGLPVRCFEDGKVYRKEQRGEPSGLSRVWSFTIDDGHLPVRSDQIKDKINLITDDILAVFGTFGLNAKVALTTRPDRSAGGDEIWEQAETQPYTVPDDSGVDYGIEASDGVFYGSKIDLAFKDALDRKWDGPTIQPDLNVPDRFDLTYTGEDNEDHQPMMIHHTSYGSYERFFIVLIEHFNGKFPFWLAPEQVCILPISDDQIGYAKKLQYELSDFRVDIEDCSWTLGRKIRETQTDRIPHMVIVGGDEERDRAIPARSRKEREAKDVNVGAFRDHLRSEYDEKRTELNLLTGEEWGPAVGSDSN